MDLIIQVAVYLDVQGFLAVTTFGFDLKAQAFFSQLPLHEGRRNRVYCSSRINLLSRAESNPVRGGVNRHRICPGDRYPIAAVEKFHV